MFWGMAFIKVEFTILLMGVFYNSLKSLRALVCEREKNLSIIHFGTGFPRRKVLCRKRSV